jgi:pentatricopeptide repeat protein
MCNSKTFIDALKACSKSRSLDNGLQIHVRAAMSGLLDRDPFIASALVDMYAKCGSLSKAIQAFNKLSFRDKVLWTSLISGYVEHGDSEQALICFERMQIEGIALDAMSYVPALKACGSLKAVTKGEGLHEELKSLGLLERNNRFLSSMLINMYAKCGCLDKAQQVFDHLHEPDVVSWNALITGYNQEGHGVKALELFDKMKLEGHLPDSVTFVCGLKACADTGNLEKGAHIHREIEKQKGLLESDPVIRSSLIDMYARCDRLDAAHNVLKRLPQ